MPRNSTGNYTLPLPPVVSGELIEATWANTTLDDIGQALTESLDRYGRGGMLAPFLFTDGTVSNPGAAWANAPGTGFFRDSTHLGFSWNGAEVLGYNAAGLTGLIESMRVSGGLTLLATATQNFRNIADTGNSWVMGAGNFYGSDVFGLYNGATLVWAFTLDPTTSDFTFGGVPIIPYGKFIRFKGSVGENAWMLGEFVNGVGTDTFEIYNSRLGRIALEFDPSNNNATFSNSIIGPLVLVQADWGGVQFAGTDGVQCGQFFGRPDGGLTIYAFDINGANEAVTDFLSTGAVFHASADFQQRINSVVDGTGNADAFVWNYGGNSRLNIKSIGGWAGFEWHMPSVSFMGVYQVSDGSLRWLAGQDIAQPIMSFHPTGQVRAKSFVASATPG